NVLKSHHSADFFSDVLPHIAGRYAVFYVFRDPVEVMRSYWRFIHTLPWVEGPKVADPIAFAAAEPMGHMMRYQMRQFPTIMHRWAAHVESWLAAAERFKHVALVRYEELDRDYEDTMWKFAGIMGRPPLSVNRPDRVTNVYAPEQKTAVLDK